MHIPTHVLFDGDRSKRVVPGLAMRLQELRRAKRMSQQSLATYAGISIPRLHDAETYGAATRDTITRLSKVLEVSVGYLEGQETKP